MINGSLYKEQQLLLPQVMLTRFFWERMRGLLFRKPLSSEQALLIRPCASIHCIGMSYPIDVVFMNKHYEIVKMVAGLKPFRFAQCAQANMTLEMQTGMIDTLNLALGDTLQWRADKP